MDAGFKRKIVSCRNQGSEIIVHLHTGGKNKQYVFNIPGFVGKSSFEIAHDYNFSKMYMETNKIGSRQKQTTSMGNR